jgi:prolyl 4-hydroxylase
VTVYIGNLDLSCQLWWTVDDVLSRAECQSVIERMERATDAETAPVLGADLRPEVNVAVRNNTRIMWSDPALAARLFERIRSHVPQTFQGGAVVGANDWLRCYRYAQDQRHGLHWDTTIAFEGGVESQLTFMIYLNDDFEGGRTLFPELSGVAAPKTGRALLFQHKILHEAERVERGIKYALRSEILYAAPALR